MNIDLHQLPIPAWGLECPKCRYRLDGLPAHRCPECGVVFTVPELIGTWTRLRPPLYTGHELPIPDFGLTCRGCDAPTAGWPTHTCPTCGRAFDPDEERPAREWFHADEGVCRPLLPPIVEMLLAARQIPHMLNEEGTAAALYMGRVAPPRLMVSTEFFFETLHVIREEALAAAAAAATEVEWKCPACGEESPSHFDVCWSCQGERPGNAGARI